MNYDVFFISSYELNSHQHWLHLKSLCPRAKRIHGATSIYAAYSQAAFESNTDYFFTVDGDNFVLNNFAFSNVKDLNENSDCIHVWRAINSVNELVYGFGGIKLWPKIKFNQIDMNLEKGYCDFTHALANGKYFIQEEVASETRFNTSEYYSWRSGFREATKLASEIARNPNEKTFQRLNIWMTVGAEKPFGKWCMVGAFMGQTYGSQHFQDKKKLSEINNTYFLEKLFQQEFVHQKNYTQLFGSEI